MARDREEARLPLGGRRVSGWWPGRPVLRRWTDRVELMDQPTAPPHLLARSLADMRRLNRLFGWQRPVLRAVQSFLPASGPCTVLDVATGSGDLPLALAGLLAPRRSSVRVIASDAHPTVLRLGRHYTANKGPVSWVGHDARRLPFPPGSVDVVTCASALHHFDEHAAITVLAALATVARRGVIVADASRSLPALLAVCVLSRFSRSPLTWHDGPLSVRRAYTAAEAVALAQRAGWQRIEVQRPDPFRWLLIGRPPYGPPAPQGDGCSTLIQAPSGATSPFNAVPLPASLISGGTAISRSS